MTNLGLNGAGFFENLTEDALMHFYEMVPTNSEITLRLPGGSITRFTDPASPNAKGWGMTAESVNAFFDKYGATLQNDEDNPGETRAGWLEKVAAQPDYRYIDKLITFINDLAVQKVTVKVIWVSNIINSNIDAQYEAISFLIDNDVDVVAVELGNEVYGKYNFDPKEYIEDYLALREQVLNDYDVSFSLISGNFSGRKEHTKWNTALAALTPDLYEFITIHYYLTEDKFPAVYANIPKGKLLVNYQTGNEDLNIATDRFVDYLMADFEPEYFINEMRAAAAFYNKPLLVTEFNSKPSGAFGNMLINGAWIFKQLISCPEDIVNTICLHNGISPDLHGCITKMQKQDDVVDLDMVKRIGFYSMYFAMKKFVANNSALTFCQPVINLSDSSLPVALNVIPDDYTVIDRVYQFVSGDYLYSSCGTLGFMDSKQPKSYEIDDVYENLYYPEDEITAYPRSFGVILTYTAPTVIEEEEEEEEEEVPVKPGKSWLSIFIKWLRGRYSSNTRSSY